MGSRFGLLYSRGDDCVQGLQQANKSFVTAGAKYVKDGAAQMVTVEHEVRALVTG